MLASCQDWYTSTGGSSVVRLQPKVSLVMVLTANHAAGFEKRANQQNAHNEIPRDGNTFLSPDEYDKTLRIKLIITVQSLDRQFFVRPEHIASLIWSLTPYH